MASMDPRVTLKKDPHRISFLIDENAAAPSDSHVQLLPVTATVVSTKKNSASNFLASPQLVVHATTMDTKDWTLPPLQNNSPNLVDKLPSIASISIPEVNLGKPNSDPSINQWFQNSKTPVKNVTFPLTLDEKLLQQTHLTDEQATLLRQISASMTAGHPHSQKLPSLNSLSASRDSARPYPSADEYIESYMSKIRAKTYCTILLDVDSLKQEDKKIVCPFSKNCRKQIKGKGNFRKHIEWHLRKIEGNPTLTRLLFLTSFQRKHETILQHSSIL